MRCWGVTCCLPGIFTVWVYSGGHTLSSGIRVNTGRIVWFTAPWLSAIIAASSPPFKGVNSLAADIYDPWSKLISYRCDIRPSNITAFSSATTIRSEEHTSELQSLRHLVCRLLL